MTGVEGVGIMSKEVDFKSLANKKQLLCVDTGFVEEALQGAFGYADALHQPLVCMALAAQLGAD